MELVLLFIAILLLFIDLDEDELGPPPATNDYLGLITGQVRAAEEEISSLTEEAVLAMLKQARAWKPGGRG